MFLTLNVLGGVGNMIGNPGSIAVLLLVNLIDLVLMILLGAKGNEMTAKALLARGWRFVEPKSEMTKYARMNWHIFDHPTSEQPQEPITIRVADV